MLGLEYELLQTLYYNTIGVLIIFLLGMVSYRFSILNTMREQKIMKKQAYTDPLTGGGNRQLFLKVTDELIQKGKKFALCFLDLDGFKQINDTMGHDAGDELLKALANMLNKEVSKREGSVYRLGGDEFAIILTNVSTTQDIAVILDAIKLEISKPMIIENTSIMLEYSLGVSIFPTDANNRKDLLAYADDAMYYIKEHGKSDYYFHNKVLKAKQDNKTKMENDLKNAYKNNEFDVEFQLRVNIEDTSIIYFEALAYWKHPVLGYLKAEYFIKQAEELGIIIKLDEFVLTKCCEKLKDLKDKGYNNVRINVNSSNMRSKRTDFIDNMCNILKEYDFEKGHIQIEFTDIIKPRDIDRFKMLIERLKKIGVDIAITNFEIEYESLALLKELDIDEVKLNAQYLDESTGLNKDVLRNIVNLSKTLNYSVIVTHVETQVEFATMLNYNVNRIQGNFLAKRISIDKVEEFIKHYEEYKKSIDNMIKFCKNG